MTGAPQWSSEEFETLITNVHVSNADLSHMLPGRSEDAINIVRHGVHSFHRGDNISMLSHMMRHRLETKTQPILCRVCRTQF